MKINALKAEVTILFNTEKRTLKLINNLRTVFSFIKNDAVQEMKVLEYKIIYKKKQLAKFFIAPSHADEMHVLIPDKNNVNLIINYYQYKIAYEKRKQNLYYYSFLNY